MKIFNRILMRSYIIISALFIVLFSNSVYAKEYFSFEEYKRNVEEGYIDENVKYEDLLALIHESKNIEKSFKDSDYFKEIYSFKSNYNLSSIKLAPGDVIITNSTSFFGLTGHAAIALDSRSILETPGKNSYVRVVSPSTFAKNYSSGWIRVYRPRYSSWGKS